MPNGWGGSLKEIRKEADISQAKLAKIARLSYSTISRLERGRTQPSEVTKRKILKALNQISSKKYKFEDIFPEKE